MLYPELMLLYYYCLITGAIPRTVDGFLPPLATSTIRRANFRRLRSDALPLPLGTTMAGRSSSSRRSSVLAPAFSTVGDDTDIVPPAAEEEEVELEEEEEGGGAKTRKTTTSYAQEADQLLALLVRRHDDGGNDRDADIERLMQSLEDARLPFDPRTGLNGPLFAALYRKGAAAPFWERYSRFGSGTGRANIKGQRYRTVTGEGAGAGAGAGGVEEDTYDLTNYAEFFGEAFSVQATATVVRNTDQPTTNDDPTTPPSPAPTPPPTPSPNPLSDLLALVSSLLSPSAPSPPSLPTPQDYTVDVAGASVRLLGRTVRFGVEGRGYLRVLYADPRLRIFTTPRDTENGFVDEKAGLTVAQVRVDLLDPDFTLGDGGGDGGEKD